MTSTLTSAEQDLLDAAIQMAPKLAERRAETVRLRRLPDESVEELERAGITRMSLPAAFGGPQVSAAAQLDILAAVAEGCGATAWVAAVYSVCGHMVCAFGDQALADFLESDTPRSAGVFSSNAVARAVDGGYHISGKWPFASGQHHAGWLITPAVPEGGELPIGFLVPKSEFVVKDDWDVTGLIGSGSNTMELTDTFVPAHRTVAFFDLLDGSYHTAALADEGYYSQPILPFMAALSSGPFLGLARSALKGFQQRIANRAITYTSYLRQADAPVTHLQMAEAHMKLDQAMFHAGRLAETADLAASGEPVDMMTRARCRADSAWSLRLSREVCEIVEQGSGANAIRAADPLAGVLRDIRALSVHSFGLYTTNAEFYGRMLSGLEPDVPFL